MRAVRAAAVLACVLFVAIVVAVLGAFQHPQTLNLGGLALPVGIVLGLAALGLTQVLAYAAAGRAGVVVASVGWLIAVTYLGTSRPEGDIVVPGDGRGTAFFWIGTLVCLGGVFVATVRSVRR